MRKLISLLLAVVVVSWPLAAMAHQTEYGVLSAGNTARVAVPMLFGSCSYIVQNKSSNSVWVGTSNTVTAASGTEVVVGASFSTPATFESTAAGTNLYVYTTVAFTNTVQFFAVCL